MLSERSKIFNPDPDVLSQSEILSANGIQFSEKEIFVHAQEIAAHNFQGSDKLPQTFTLHKTKSGIFFIKKIFLINRRHESIRVSELMARYQIHLESLRRANVSQLAQNYRVSLTENNDISALVVEQLFFPNGTALDWVRQNFCVGNIVEEIVVNHILPILSYPSPTTVLTDGITSMDTKLSNFAVVPTAKARVKVFYFDFFPPRIRDDDGNYKTVLSPILDPVEQKSAEYRFLTKPGIIHNFIRRGYYYLFSDGEATLDKLHAWEEFKQVANYLLAEYIDLYFPGKSVQELSGVDFCEYIDYFVSRK